MIDVMFCPALSLWGSDAMDGRRFFVSRFFSEAWRLGFDRCLVLLGGLLFAYASRGCVSERGKRWISWSCLLHLLLTKRTDKPRFIYDRCAALTCVMYVSGSY
jgi:hypothetical protein